MRRNVLLPIVVLLIAIVLYQPIQVLAEKKVESSVAQYVINEMGVFKNEQQIISSKDKEYCIKDKILYSKDMKQLIRVGDVTGKLILPSTIEKIAPYAFCYSNLSEIVLGKRVTQIASTSFCKTPKLKKKTKQNKPRAIALNNQGFLSNIFIGMGLAFV